MQYIPCNSALLAQEALFLPKKALFLPKDLQKVRKSRKAIWVLQIKVWKRVDPPPPMWNLFIKKIFFLLQMNASLRFQVSGACLTLNFDFWAQGAQFMCLPKTPNIILGQKLGLNPPPGSQTLMTTRVFKLVRHFAGLQSLLHTLQQAYQVPIMKCWPV